MHKIEETINILDGIAPLKPIKGHRVQKTDWWTMTGWKKDEVWFDDRHIIDEIEKLERDLHEDIINRKNTCPRPTYIENRVNIITLIGLTQSAKRDTGEAAGEGGGGGVQYVSVGSGSTAEVEGNTDLETEFTNTLYARKDLDATGQRKVINQTAKYGVLFDDTSFDSTPQDIKEAGLNWHTTDSSKLHARVTFTTFQLNAGDIFVIQINELQENA